MFPFYYPCTISNEKLHTQFQEKGKLSIHQKPYFLQHYLALQYTSLLLKDKETTPAMLLANIYVYKNYPWLTSAIDCGDPPLAAVTMTKPF
jgi:hypothetical protein